MEVKSSSDLTIWHTVLPTSVGDLTLVRDPVYYGRVPDLFTVSVAALIALVSLLTGFAVFQRFAPRHIHYL